MNEVIVCQKCNATRDDLCDLCGKCVCACVCTPEPEDGDDPDACDHGVSYDQYCVYCDMDEADEEGGDGEEPDDL